MPDNGYWEILGKKNRGHYALRLNLGNYCQNFKNFFFVPQNLFCFSLSPTASLSNIIKQCKMDASSMKKETELKENNKIFYVFREFETLFHFIPWNHEQQYNRRTTTTKNMITIILQVKRWNKVNMNIWEWLLFLLLLTEDSFIVFTAFLPFEKACIGISRVNKTHISTKPNQTKPANQPPLYGFSRNELQINLNKKTKLKKANGDFHHMAYPSIHLLILFQFLFFIHLS